MKTWRSDDDRFGRLLLSAYWRGTVSWESVDEYEQAGWIQTADDFLTSVEDIQ